MRPESLCDACNKSNIAFSISFVCKAAGIELGISEDIDFHDNPECIQKSLQVLAEKASKMIDYLREVKNQ